MATIRSIGQVIREVDNPLFKKAVAENPTIGLPLFPQDGTIIPEKIPEPTTRQQSWKALVDSGKLSQHQFLVLSVLEKLWYGTDKMIGQVLGWEINRVTPRRGELMQQGYITKHDEVLDSTTNRMCARWKLKE